MSMKVTQFNEYFDIVSADSADLLEEAYRLRFQVLSLEEHVPDFETHKYADGLERDDYDRRSVHSLLRYRPTGKFVGTVRLILCDPVDVTRAFPVERYTGKYFDPRLIDLTKLPRAQTAEISRLVVLRNIRLRQGDAMTAYGNLNIPHPSREDRRQAAEPFLALLAAVLVMTVDNGVAYWYAGMERKLNVRLARLGLQLEPIGPLVEYHGPRQPHMSRVEDVVNRMHAKHRDIWRLLTLDGKLWPEPCRKAVSGAGR